VRLTATPSKAGPATLGIRRRQILARQLHCGHRAAVTRADLNSLVLCVSEPYAQLSRVQCFVCLSAGEMAMALVHTLPPSRTVQRRSPLNAPGSSLRLSHSHPFTRRPITTLVSSNLGFSCAGVDCALRRSETSWRWLKVCAILLRAPQSKFNSRRRGSSDTRFMLSMRTT